MRTVQTWSRPSAPLISLQGVTKSFARGLARATRRTLALADVDFEVFAGDVILVSGEEGSGKTTLLQCACRILKADEGVVRGTKVSYVPAVPIYYPFLTVRDVVSLKCESKERVEELLALFDLRPVATGAVATLSPAGLKRLAIAEGLAANPDVILIDTSALEVPSRTTIAAVAETGTAAVVAARNCSGLTRIASRIVCLEEGRITRVFNTSHSLVAERMH